MVLQPQFTKKNWLNLSTWLGKISALPISSPPSAWPVGHVLTTLEFQETKGENCLTNTEPLRTDHFRSKSCDNSIKSPNNKPKCNICLIYVCPNIVCPKAYADLVINFISSLTNLVLQRRYAYLCHAHSNLDAF